MKNQLVSQRLQVNTGIMEWYVKELTKMTAQMTKECKEELSKIYKQGYPQIAFDSGAGAKGGSDELSTVSTFDESISSQARITLSLLYKKYSDKFGKKAKILVKSLIKRTNRYSNSQINNALKGMLGAAAKDFILKGSAITTEKEEIFKALIFENVSLIKSIKKEKSKCSSLFYSLKLIRSLILLLLLHQLMLQLFRDIRNRHGQIQHL